MPNASMSFAPSPLANCAVFKVRLEGAPQATAAVHRGPTEGRLAERPARGRSLKTQQHVLLNRLSAFDQARSTC